MRNLFHRWRLFRPVLSPAGLAARAGAIVLMFFTMHAAGARRFTSILCGMNPAGQPGTGVTAVLGLLYVLVYVGFTVVAPILVLAAVMLFIWNRCHADDRTS